MTLSPFDSLDIQPAEKKTIHPPQSVDDVEKHVQPAHAILQTAKHSNTLASLGHIMQNDDSRASQCGSSAGCSGAGGEEAAIAAMEREKLQAICAFLNSEEVIAQLGY